MIRIESASNSIYKQTKKLLSVRGRKKTNMFIIEGERLVRDACRKGAQLEYIIISEKYSGEITENVRTYVMDDRLFDTLKDTVTSQGILAAVCYMHADEGDIDFSAGGCYLFLDRIADPGNMGTILRSADAFGVKGVIVSPGCADIYSPKVIRSTMSGIFDISIYFGGIDLLNSFKNNGYAVVGTFPGAASDARGCDYTNKCVIVMGNEANGISDEIAKICDKKVTIPMTEGAESLNVSVACGIILYERFVSMKNSEENVK